MVSWSNSTGFKFVIFLATVALSVALVSSAEACSRALYVGKDGLVITGRSMDWGEDMGSELWVFPRGMERNGKAGSNSVTWTSKYGSLIVCSYGIGSAEGMNEKGLVINGLFLTESDYGQPDDRPTMSISILVQYLLDNFRSVSGAVKEMRSDPIRIIAPTLPNGRTATMHISLSDPTGDSAIFEWLDGELVIHHGKEYKVLTNSPSYEQQLAIKKYWEGVDPLEFMPGSIRGADRFARLSYYINNLPTKSDPKIITAVPEESYKNQAALSMLSAIRSIGTPLGVSAPKKANLSSSLWRTVWNQTDKVLYFDSATTPNTFWVPFSKLEFSADAEVKKLPMDDGEVYAGDASDKFVATEPFEFMPAKAN